MGNGLITACKKSGYNFQVQCPLKIPLNYACCINYIFSILVNGNFWSIIYVHKVCPSRNLARFLHIHLSTNFHVNSWMLTYHKDANFSFNIVWTFLFKSLIKSKDFKSANIMETQFFDKMKNDLKGHNRSHKGPFMSKNHIFLRYYFCMHYKLYMNANIRSK